MKGATIISHVINNFYCNFIPSGEIIPLDDIEKIHKKRRHDYDSRLETVLVGF